MPSANECEITQFPIPDLSLVAYYMLKPEADIVSVYHG